MEKPTSYRSTKAVESKIKDLLEKFPEDYKNKSEVLRAGVIQLHKQKIENKGKFFGRILN